jgi:two-component system, NtrC family, nitrogen regulation sensor histidine kinase NtrY
MQMNRYRLTLVLLTIVVVLLSLFMESVYFSDFEYRYRTRLFNKTLQKREQIMEECLKSMEPLLARENHHGSGTETDIFSVAEKNQITILEYLDNNLHYWSDNCFSIPRIPDDSLFAKPLVFLQNGWFLSKTVEAGNEKIVGLLRIRTDYGFENEIIKGGFEKAYQVPYNVGLNTDPKASSFHVMDKEGNFLFSLVFPEDRKNTYFILLPLLAWSLVFVLLILLVIELSKILAGKGRNVLAVILIFILFSGIYLFILVSGKPSVFFQTELFSPYRFSLNIFFPTLGHLMFFSILSIIFIRFLFFHIPVKLPEKRSDPGDLLFLSIHLLIVSLLFTLFHSVFSKLVLTSNVNFETYKVLDLNVFSMAGFISAILLLMVPVFYIFEVFRSARLFETRTVIFSVAISVIVPLLFFIGKERSIGPLIAFYILIATGTWITLNKGFRIFNMTVIFAIVSGFYFLWYISKLSEEKTTENLKIQAVTLSTENDPEAEQLLLDMWPFIKIDTALSRIMLSEHFEQEDEKISGWLRDNYFNGYWGNFNFRILLCRNDDPLRIGTENNVSRNCFDFIYEKIKLDGHRLTGTEFYFIENQGGRPYYLGKLEYITPTGHVNGLFIELYSDVDVFEPGYSELLLDKKFHSYSRLKDCSFAKYINGEIVLRMGDFPFDKTDAEYVDKVTDFRIFRSEGYKHILYKNGNATVMISRILISAGDLAISFAYLFCFILCITNIFILILRRPKVRNMNFFNFSQKLQLSFIGILIFSFLLIGVVVASFTIKQYQAKHIENLREKLNSIYIELDSKLSMEKHLSADWRNESYISLNDLLVKLSNVFNTDINLYDNYTGYLIATSRQEIFYRNLTSQRINNTALNNLRHLTRSEYLQKEKIGSLEYISAYVPFYGTEGETIAYLNLPYFRMQSILANEISDLVVAVINFTILLVLITMGLAVLISRWLTSPLKMLTEGLASVEVGKKSEQLSYRGNDEIGELVKQYNRMVDEIEESTHKLANSEREYAWREMAKQIAHEIKNPLTPMKLNIQQLFKSWKDKAPGFDKSIEKFTENQIEYIDNLSSIASAFSSFAKMPLPNPVDVNLVEQLNTTLELFKSTADVSFNVIWPKEKKVIVSVDKEHLSGAFSNLIKNGIQAIPAGKDGLIEITMKVLSDKVLVSVSDNGTGIPEELQKNLFTPNFTTKSSGMGLGLSIVKRYIESANGRIWFSSELNIGSVFYVELPLKYTVENLGKTTVL